jgi:hypothetical protein
VIFHVGVEARAALSLRPLLRDALGPSGPHRAGG